MNTKGAEFFIGSRINSFLIPSKDVDLRVFEHHYHLVLDDSLLDDLC
jgi:hypothetical protein